MHSLGTPQSYLSSASATRFSWMPGVADWAQNSFDASTDAADVVRKSGPTLSICGDVCMVCWIMLFHRSATLGVLLVMVPGYVLSQGSRQKFQIGVEVFDVSGAVFALF
jgi:hypothetical protein